MKNVKTIQIMNQLLISQVQNHQMIKLLKKKVHQKRTNNQLKLIHQILRKFKRFFVFQKSNINIKKHQ